MSDGIWQVQQAVYTRLTTAAPPIAGGQIFDQAPQDITGIWVQIGNLTATPNDADGLSGTEEFLTLDIWDHPGDGGGHVGAKQVLEVMDAIHTELHNTVLVVSGRTALIWVQDTRIIEQSDGISQHGTVRLKISSYETA